MAQPVTDIARSGNLPPLSPEWWAKHLDLLTEWLVTDGARIVLIVVLLFVGLRVGRAFVRRSVTLAVRPTGRNTLQDLMLTKRQATLTSLFDAVLTITLLVVAALMIFQALGFAVGPLLASAGIAGVAIGLGAQSLVKDVLSGVFIVLERQFSVGDVVRIGANSGAVEELNLRTVVLRDGDGGVHIIPNGQIDRVTVLTRDWSRLQLDFDIGYGADLDQATAILERVFTAYAAAHPADVLEPPEVLGVQNLAESSVQIRVWMKVLPGKQWPAGRELRALVKKAFDEAGIEIPFPQRTIWMRSESPSA
jgi:small conductance mechanosensitive channel